MVKVTNRYPSNCVTAKRCYTVVCFTRSCILYNNDEWYRTKRKDAIDAWNRRPEDNVGK